MSIEIANDRRRLEKSFLGYFFKIETFVIIITSIRYLIHLKIGIFVTYPFMQQSFTFKAFNVQHLEMGDSEESDINLKFKVNKL